MKNIYHEIKLEREKQKEKWSEEHDNRQTCGDYHCIIDNIISDISHSQINNREGFIKIAAVAVAAIEAYDRHNDIQVAKVQKFLNERL